MNWDRVEGSWTEFKGKVKQRWGELSDDDVAHISGRRDELIGRLQARYGYGRDRARQEIDRWLDAMDGPQDEVLNRANAAKDQLMDVADNFSGALRKSIKENPSATLALTAMVGFVLGVLWKS